MVSLTTQWEQSKEILENRKYFRVQNERWRGLVVRGAGLVIWWLQIQVPLQGRAL